MRHDQVTTAARRRGLAVEKAVDMFVGPNVAIHRFNRKHTKQQLDGRQLNRFVAIKTIVSGLDKHDDLRRRFQREAQSAAQLNHPNIISVYDFGEDQGKIYMAMELLEGTDLREIIRAKKSLTLDEKLRLMEQVCDGLGFAHAKEIVHRGMLWATR